MCLLDALRCILCCGQGEQEQDFYSYRNYSDYSSLNPPSPRSTSPPQDRFYRYESRPLLPPARSIVDSRGNLKLPDVTSSYGDGNGTIFPNLSSPSLSSSVRGSSTTAPSSSTFAPVSSTNSNISVAGLSIGPEKFEIKKDSATRTSERPYTTSQLSKFPSSSISSSAAPAPLSQKPSFVPVSSLNSNGSVAGLSIGPEKLQIMKDSATCSPETPYTASQLSKVPSPSISSSSAPAPSSKKPPLASISSGNKKISVLGIPIGREKLQISPERPGEATLLLKFDSLSISASAKDSISQAPQSKASSSKKPSSATVSSTNSSISEAPVRVWQVKFPTPPDSTTKLVEKQSLSSPSLPSSRKHSVSPAPSLKPSPVHISTANNSVSWRKKKQTSTESSRESLQNLPALSPSLIKVASTDSSSSSESSSPSSSLESRISNRRVLPKYEIPKYLEEMIRNDIVPPVLKRPLSPSTYCDFFATLLYAEDFYLEKWSEYLLEGITLELHHRNSSSNSQEMSMKRKNTMLVQRDFVSFEIDSVPEKRPYLLSRDFVFLKPLNEIAGPFKGILFRVVKSRTVLVEFGDDFHSQHSPSKRYDVSFSFNRVCLKRAHQAISVASDPSFHSILFPDQSFSSHPNTFHLHENVFQFQGPVTKILNHKGPIPYLVKGQLSVVKRRIYYQNDQETCLSFTGLFIQAAMLNIYRTNPHCRILVCSPTNITSDVLLRSLREEIPESSLFRANAAFRDYLLVPDDIIPASLYEEEEERFACPPLAELLNFNVITCTFMSSFRLHTAGINLEHFTHIFLVDASLATEPEAIIPLANFAGKNTVIVVTGCSDKSPSWVRSDIARRHGLKTSYFNRLLVREPYRSCDVMFIAHLE